MKRTAIFAWVWLAASTLAVAAPLQPEHVSADAKWVFHIDFEALRDTSLAQKLREEEPQAVRGAIEWLQKEYGIDLREDLNGLTAYSDTFEEHTGAIVLYAAYDRDKVQAKISKQNAKETKWQNYTFYTWNVKDRKDADHEITVVLVDDEKTVFASSHERAQKALQLLAGKGESLARPSAALAAEVSKDSVPPGAAVYGAAIDLGELKRREHAFPILQRHKRVTWAFGEHQGELFETATFVAESEEVAEEMDKVLQGAMALVKLWANNKENLTSIADATKITREGDTVKLSWRANVPTVLAAIDEFKQQVQENYRKQ